MVGNDNKRGEKGGKGRATVRGRRYNYAERSPPYQGVLPGYPSWLRKDQGTYYDELLRLFP